MKKYKIFGKTFSKPIRSESKPDRIALAAAPARPKKHGSDGSGSATLKNIFNFSKFVVG